MIRDPALVRISQIQGTSQLLQAAHRHRVSPDVDPMTIFVDLVEVRIDEKDDSIILDFTLGRVLRVGKGVEGVKEITLSVNAPYWPSEYADGIYQVQLVLEDARNAVVKSLSPLAQMIF